MLTLDNVLFTFPTWQRLSQTRIVTLASEPALSICQMYTGSSRGRLKASHLGTVLAIVTTLVWAAFSRRLWMRNINSSAWNSVPRPADRGGRWQGCTGQGD